MKKNGFAKIFVAVLLAALLSLLIFAVTGCPNVVNPVNKAATYKVVYYGNGNTGGSVPADSKLYKQGDIVTVLGNTGSLVKKGYTFIGWNIRPDGSSNDYTTDSTFTIGIATVSLYANWIAPKRQMSSVPKGTYTQKDTSGNSFTHIISSFSIAKYDVTYELWHAVYIWATAHSYTFANAGTEGHNGTAGAAPTAAKNEPVTTINWRDAMVWCNAYSEMAGFVLVYKNGSGEVIKDSTDTNGTECDNAVPDWSSNGYRLPTEGEWQYAASYQDGSNWTPYNYASGATADYTNATATGFVAWYTVNSGSTVHDVGTKKANQLGIYDMSGNVFDWCWDWNGAWPTTTQTDYRGPVSGAARVSRGGNSGTSAGFLQVGFRYSIGSSSAGTGIGFRPVRSL